MVKQKSQQKNGRHRKSKRVGSKKNVMNKGVKTIIYPVEDVMKAKTVFQKFLGVEPYSDQPYYVGFKVDDQDVGFIPKSPGAAMTAFYHVDDIKKDLQIFLDSGAEIVQDIKNVGGERLIASVKDKDNNIIGLIQN
jgi:predicted enzyme related to lactoylglutathione lyase